MTSHLKDVAFRLGRKGNLLGASRRCSAHLHHNLERGRITEENTSVTHNTGWDEAFLRSTFRSPLCVSPALISNEQTSHHRLIHVQGLSSAPSNFPKLSVTDEHPAHESGGSPPGSTPGGTATSAARARSESRARSSQFSEYDVAEVRDYFRWRPFTVALRMATIVTEILILRLLQYTQPDIQKRAAKGSGVRLRVWVQLRRSLIRLGPFYVKLGQALSTRPDIMPPAYCAELALLQDQIPPFPSPQALAVVAEELGAPADEIFAHISPEPVAAASLGQVYKARLQSGEVLAVKVQRPGLVDILAVDAYVLRSVASLMQRVMRGRESNLTGVVDELVGRLFEEVDYLREGHNAERFAQLYGSNATTGSVEDGGVKVPRIYWEYTTRRVLTMEWVEGLKLTDHDGLREANLDTQHLVDMGVLCSLRQLLEEGFFHADPHPGNLVVTREGQLAYFDFGMMSEMKRDSRIGLIRTLVHYVNRDADGLAADFASLGFLPPGTPLAPIAGALRDSFGDENSRANLDFQGIMAQLSSVMYRFHFRLPPEFSLVIRALGSLEGTATAIDPQFKVVASAYPFIVGRLLVEADPGMRSILKELLIRPNGSFRWNRLERLVLAIAEQNTTGQPREREGGAGGGGVDNLMGRAGLRGTFDREAMMSAFSDLLEYVLSDRALRVRGMLVGDIVGAAQNMFREAINGRLLEGLSEGEREAVVDSRGGVGEDGEGRGRSEKMVAGWEAGRKLEEVAAEGAEAAHRHSAEREAARKLEEVGAEGGRRPSHRKPPEVPGGSGRRMAAGMRAAAEAVGGAPEVWVPLMLRTALRPEARALLKSVAKGVLGAYGDTTSQAAFLSISQRLKNSGY